MSANLENSSVATGLEKVSFHSDPREWQCQRMFKLPYNCTYLTCYQGNVQNPVEAQLQELEAYANQELSDVKFGFRKDRATRDQITNICWIIKKARGFQRNVYFCYTDYTKAFEHEFNQTPGHSEGQGNLAYSSPWGHRVEHS